MNEQLTPRIYREYCWFALLLLVLAIGIVSRPRLGGTIPRANPIRETSSPAAVPPLHQP